MAVGSILALALAACPAVAADGNAAPRIVSAKATSDASTRLVRVVVVGRDRDDVVRGAEIAWGEPAPALGLSACEESSRPRKAERGRKARFVFTHTYATPGHYAVTVQVLSGGCAKRAQQRSEIRTLTVHVD
jgi:hypothetical protein